MRIGWLIAILLAGQIVLSGDAQAARHQEQQDFFQQRLDQKANQANNQNLNQSVAPSA